MPESGQKALRYIFAVILLLTFLSLSGLLWHGSKDFLPSPVVGEGDVGNHHDPKVLSASSTDKTYLRTFGNIPELEDLSPAGDAAWANATQTPGGGFLNVWRNETFSLGYGVTMFHALHCLRMIRRALQSFQKEGGRNGTESTNGTHYEPRSSTSAQHQSHRVGNDLDQHRRGMEHVGHCLAYIAETLLCSADGTIEPALQNLDEDGQLVGAVVDGAGVTHQCRDMSILWDRVRDSERVPVKLWHHQIGDTIESVFGPKV